MGRLLAGSIEFVGKVGNKYDVSTSYNKAGGLESKVSSPDASTQVYAGTSQEMTYDLTYQYSGTKPHQLSEVISSQGVPYAMSFSYNASGSISEITDMMGVDHSSYYWGQEQWLCGVENTQGIHHYVYDHAGERIMKSSITQTTVQLNDETINTVTTLEPYTLYVNPYYVVTSFSNADQRSKHYYMGTQRVATDIGVDYGMSPSPEQTERARGGDDAAMTEATQGLETDQVPFQSLGYKQDLERVLLGLSGEIGVEDLSEALAPIESFYPELSAGVNSGEGIESEPPLYIGTRIMYWYHPDYVSNVDMVTDKSGEAYELFLYNAWGESLHHWSSSSTNSWSSPYRLNSKELDSETGMHYYGARYHHPKLSVWMSVDPKAAEMPSWSPYSFAFNNPIFFIDPDGMKPTPSQAASMAWHIYDGKKGDVVDGWTLSDVYTNKDNLGYKAGLYTREVDGVMEYTMVNMGTIPGTGKKNRDSMWENIEQPVGASDHMNLSLDQARELNSTLGPDADLTFVGHSKGGAEAAANAVATNKDAYVFNPAAVNLNAYGMDSKNYSASMTAFVVKGDPVAKTYPLLFANPIDKLIMLPRQSWTNPIENHNNFREALRQYLENNTIQD
jgi:RHS repeat-associated protein